MAETGSMVENLRDGVRGFFHSQSPKEAQFHKVQPGMTTGMWRTPVADHDEEKRDGKLINANL